MMNELENFVQMSKYAGERFDIVQSGGGNSSVKLEDGVMLIKASGFSLSEVTTTKGFVKVDNNQIKQIFQNEEILKTTDKRVKEKLSGNLVSNSILSDEGRPSIETMLHSILLKYTLHTHPIAVNVIAVQKNWKEELLKVFPESMCVSYQTPGIELALELSKELETFKRNNNTIPKIIFLQNHGVIISSDSYEDIVRLNEYVLEKLEKHLGLDFSAHKQVSKLSKLYNSIYKENMISYVFRSNFLNSILKEYRRLYFVDSFCPDGQVFCGRKAVLLKDFSDRDAILNYEKEFHHPPRIFIVNNQIFCIAPSIKKAKEIEDVLEFGVSVLYYSGENRNYLEEKEVMYLENWDAEKYRQKL